MKQEELDKLKKIIRNTMRGVWRIDKTIHPDGHLPDGEIECSLKLLSRYLNKNEILDLFSECLKELCIGGKDNFVLYE